MKAALSSASPPEKVADFSGEAGVYDRDKIAARFSTHLPVKLLETDRRSYG
jgi:hypothetical protein